jgi:hypothetical protein
MGVTIPPLPNTPSWRGTHFKKKSIGTTLPLPFLLPIKYVYSVISILHKLCCWQNTITKFQIKPQQFLTSCSSSDSTVTRLRTGRTVFDSQQGLGFVLLTTTSKPALGPTQSPTEWVWRALFPGVKRLKRKSDQLPPSVPRLRMHGTAPPLPNYVFIMCCLIKQ